MHQFGDLISFPGCHGVSRFVSSGVNFTAPPLAAQWRAVPSEPGRFELVWDGDPAAARTLRSLRADLDRAARTGELTKPNHPLLRELDEVADTLAATASQLHAAGWSLGLLQPDNVLIRGRDGAREVVPVDLGFTWKGSFGSPPWDDNPGRPDWVEPQPGTRWLWDRPPIEQQFASPKNGSYEPVGPVADLCVLGRLLAWLLSGQSSKDVRTTSGAPAAWSLLAEAANGHIDSADEFRDRLRQAPLSEYFAPPKVLKASTASSKLVPLALAGLIGLFAIAGGVWYFAIRDRAKPEETVAGTGKPPDGVPTPIVDPTPDPEPEKPRDPAVFENELKEYDALPANDFTGLFAGLEKLYATVPKERLAEVEAKREKLVADWIAAVQEAIRLGDDPANRLDAAARLDELEAELKALIAARPAADPAQREKEQQCLDFVATFARQFGPPR